MTPALLFFAASLSAPVIADRDVAYAENGHELQKLDVYSTLQGDDRPVIVYVHGGGWKRGDKKAVGLKVKSFVQDHNWVLVSVNYRLHPEASYRDQATDVAKAIDWVTKNIDEYGGSSKQVVLMGHSAGAHLAALTACDPTYLQSQRIKPDMLAGVVLLDGAGYDIVVQSNSSRPTARLLYQSVFGTDVEVGKHASPLHHVGEDKLPPFLVCHVADRPDSKAQSTNLVEAINKAGGSAQRIAAEGKTHATINRDVGNPDDPFSVQVHKFIMNMTETVSRSDN